MVAVTSADKPTMECETEHFLGAQRQLDEIAEEMGLDRELHERLRYPKRALIVTVPVRIDPALCHLFDKEGLALQPVLPQAKAA